MSLLGPQRTIKRIDEKVERLCDHVHNVQFIYPTGVAPITLTSGVGAWTLSAAFTEIIPNAGVGDIFDIHWTIISAPSANEDFEIVLYAVEVEIARIAFTREAAQDKSTSIGLITPRLPADTQIQAKMMDGSGESTAKIKLAGHIY